jgi:hypothetical protein
VEGKGEAVGCAGQGRAGELEEQSVQARLIFLGEGELQALQSLPPSDPSELDSSLSSFPSRGLGRAPCEIGRPQRPLPSRALSHTIGSSFSVNPQPLI